YDIDVEERRGEHRAVADATGDGEVERRRAPPGHRGHQVQHLAAVRGGEPLDGRLAYHHVDGVLAERVGDPAVDGLVRVHQVVGVEHDALQVALVVPNPDL